MINGSSKVWTQKNAEDGSGQKDLKMKHDTKHEGRWWCYNKLPTQLRTIHSKFPVFQHKHCVG